MWRELRPIVYKPASLQGHDKQENKRDQALHCLSVVKRYCPILSMTRCRRIEAAQETLQITDHVDWFHSIHKQPAQ